MSRTGLVFIKCQTCDRQELRHPLAKQCHDCKNLAQNTARPKVPHG